MASEPALLRDPLLGEGPGRGQPHAASYWAALSGEPPADEGALAGEHEVDVAVVGGGYTGLSAAYHLARENGARVAVLEANRPGWGCSGRNGGFARPAFGRHSPAKMIELWGIETARRVFAEGMTALATTRRLIHDGGIDCDATADGHLKIAHRPSRLAGLAADAKVLREQYGYETRLIDAEELRVRHLGGPQSHGALYLPDAIGLNPLKLAFGMLRLTRRAGARVFSASPVVGWSKDGERHVLATPSGRVRAGNVVLATNGYTAEGLHQATNLRLLPVLSHIIVTRPMTPAEKAESAFHTSHVLTDTRTLLYYFRRLPDDRIMFGGRGQIVDSPATRATQRDFLLAELKRKAPALRATTVDYDWAGWVCITADAMPHIHHAEDDPTVTYALGYQGSGVALSLHAGKILADRLGGRPVSDLPPALSPLPRFPLAALRRTAQRAAFWWWRFRDERG
ncbi:MAG TPA: FAD-binding oxidoreductase [Alphaproteobacteria bacterium]|nr:FAD-binding oxidoreductase [Alphaproteobacteria bacterium]